MKTTIKYLFMTALMLAVGVAAYGAEPKQSDYCKFAVNPDPIYEVDSLTHCIYYKKPNKYSMSHFMGGIDIPTNFGVGFIPDKKSAERFAYYSAMFLEYRYRKSYGWYFQAGLDSHDHDYKDYFMQDPDGKSNVMSGTVFNMQLVAGGGYRIPLVSDIKAFYERPYVNRWNLATLVAVGGAWSRMKFVEESKDNATATEQKDMTYHLRDDHHFYPVLKLGVAVEYFTSPNFSIFLGINYMQHLMRQPWDTPNMTGTLNFGIGFAGFFN